MAALVLLTALLISPVNGTRSQDGFAALLGSHGPTGTVRVTRPSVGWEIWPEKAGSPVTATRLVIDGRVQTAEYIVAKRRMEWTPTEPLAAGTHRVECRVTFEGKFNFNKSWEFTIGPNPLDSFPEATPQQRQALAATNRLRARLGLPPHIMDDRFNFAAQGHSAYMRQNDESGHEQTPGKPGFTGRTVEDRLGSLGVIGGTMEGVESGSADITRAVRNLFDAPLHRIPFLQPGAVLFGSGIDNGRTTLNFGISAEPGLVLSPGNGEKNIPLSWYNAEIPNPLANFPTAPKRLGYPIVLAHFGQNPLQGPITAKLTGEDGQEVPCFLARPPDFDGAILFPQSPLEANKTYTATFTLHPITGDPKEHQTTFTTVPLSSPGERG